MKNVILSGLMVALVACSAPTEQPIDFGGDACEHCQMTIVDRQHAAELVTTKGRAYKFDAIECMVGFQAAFPDRSAALLLVCDYATPGTMIDASTATFVVSEQIPSPMGANLSACATPESAKKLMDQFTGQALYWSEIPAYLKGKGLLR
ncbi:MAG: nitrous oxide reductase accessory protein NosL [Lewinellaceae bacterium]|nr:nitrous oxide reductase accessory protein NosL [Lewinellaceae bacterium]